LLISLESLRAERNQNATYMKKAGKPEQEVIEKGRELKQLIQEKEDQLKQIEESLETLMALVPMIPSEDTPIGKDESGNIEVRRWNKKPEAGPPSFDFNIKDHIELGQDLNLLDLEEV